MTNPLSGIRSIRDLPIENKRLFLRVVCAGIFAFTATRAHRRAGLIKRGNNANNVKPVARFGRGQRQRYFQSL